MLYRLQERWWEAIGPGEAPDPRFEPPAEIRRAVELERSGTSPPQEGDGGGGIHRRIVAWAVVVYVAASLFCLGLFLGYYWGTH